MSTDTTTASKTRVCPTCGTRLSENATRCTVCGTALDTPAASKAAAKAVQGSRMPEVTLSLPAVLGLLALFIVIGAALVYFVVVKPGALPGAPAAIVPPSPSPTETLTPTVTQTPAPTLSPTPEMTATPIPPQEYKVASGDTCLTIASVYRVSVLSIINANNGKINSQCSNLIPGSTILVPVPTPTATVAASATLNPTERAAAKCQTADYTVKDNDTLSSIAANYAVTMSAIKEYNGMVNDNVFSGDTLKIPLCNRTTDPTATPTNPPPYPAASLLLPADGAAFTVANDTVTLQWSAVGTLRNNEAYAVTVEDITAGTGRKLVDYVTDTKYIVPATFRPTDSLPHVMRWTILPVRQTGTTKDNTPIWEPAGAVSAQRDFTWSGVAPAATATP